MSGTAKSDAVTEARADGPGLVAPLPPGEWRFAGEDMASPLRLIASAPTGVVEATGTAGDVDHAARAAAAWATVLATFEAAEQALSRFRGSSDLTAINRRTGQDAEAGRLLVRALTAADRAHRRTGGRFDPRVLVALERIGYAGAPIRDAGDAHRPVTLAVRRADGRVLRRTGRGVIRVDVPVDLGGIGKGLALRWAANRIAATDLEPLLAAGGGFLIDAGQDIATRGHGPDGPWLIDIEDPSGRRDGLAVVALPGGWSVATSSTRLRRWAAAGGQTVHHLIDPRTGAPGGQGLDAVTVAGRDPAWAEIWSKALFLEGARGIGEAARHEGLAAWWATTEGRLEMTPAARPLTIWLASEPG